MMDLGATLCSTRKPDCVRCPLARHCLAYAQGQPESYPVKTRKLKRSSEAFWLLRAQRPDSSVHLQQRPTPGVWAGLYSLPMYTSREALMDTLTPTQRKRCTDHPAFLHVLTHKDMHLHVVELAWTEAAWPEGAGQWFSVSALVNVGLPAPIRKLLA
jgi:A/G-specific adenine glycosylase